MKFTQILATIVISAIVAGGVAHFSGTAQQTAAKESVYDRVMRTGTLRCAYLAYPPEIMKDPNTGKLSGYVVDITEEIGRQLNLKIDWVTELGFGFQDITEGFKLGRLDAACTGFVETAAHARAVLFSTPIDYGPEYVYVRADDTRFDQSLDGLNNPDIKIAQIDGEASQAIAKEMYPLASSFSLPEMSGLPLSMEALATGKADAIILTIAAGKDYMDHNPGKLKVLRKRPVKSWIQPTMAFPHGEHDLKYVVDATLRALEENGFIERTFRKYDPNLDSYLMVAKPYQVQ